MCLFINHLEPKIANKDIVCYKLVKRTKIKGVYESNYLKFEYIIRQLYTNYFDIKYADMLIKKRYSRSVIEEDMFHSYASNVYSILKPLQYCILLKCIIPKGAYYFKGYYGNYSSYASSQIKILEEL